jgi:hypothetical protein
MVMMIVAVAIMMPAMNADADTDAADMNADAHVGTCCARDHHGQGDD